MAVLSNNDKHILATLINPESNLSQRHSNHVEDIESIPGWSHARFDKIKNQELEIMKTIDEECPSDEKLQEAQSKLSQLINQYPDLPSPYINRAQLIRVQIPVQSLFTISYAEESKCILSDLDTGIRIASSSSSSNSASNPNNSRFSSYQTNILATALAHRGLLLLKIADTVRVLDESADKLPILPDRLMNKSPEEVEEMANRDFTAAAKHGNSQAAQWAVQTNPYAKMCGAIVNEAIKKEMDEAGMMCN